MLHAKGSTKEKGSLAQQGEATTLVLEGECLGHLNIVLEETYPYYERLGAGLCLTAEGNGEGQPSWVV